VGTVQISFAHRSCFVGALIMGDKVLPGVATMEDLNLIIHSNLLRIQFNLGPNVARIFGKVT